MGINSSNSSGRIADNVLTDNGVGVQLLVPADRTRYPLARVTGHQVSRNVSGGIRLDGGSGAAIGTNDAVENGSYGVYAPGAVDLGSNHASGNNAIGECVGVVCTPRP